MPIADDLRARLASLKSTHVVMSPDDKEEMAIRDEIAGEEKRLEAENAEKKRLANARLLENEKRKAGPDAICELVDLDEAGVFIVRNAPTLVGDALQEAIRENGKASGLDQVNFVIGSMVYPDPEVAGVDIRDRFDKFTFAATSLFNVVSRLSGLKIKERAAKS